MKSQSRKNYITLIRVRHKFMKMATHNKLPEVEQDSMEQVLEVLEVPEVPVLPEWVIWIFLVSAYLSWKNTDLPIARIVIEFLFEIFH